MRNVVSTSPFTSALNSKGVVEGQSANQEKAFDLLALLGQSQGESDFSALLGQLTLGDKQQVENILDKALLEDKDLVNKMAEGQFVVPMMMGIPGPQVSAQGSVEGDGQNLQHLLAQVKNNLSEVHSTTNNAAAAKSLSKGDLASLQSILNKSVSATNANKGVALPSEFNMASTEEMVAMQGRDLQNENLDIGNSAVQGNPRNKFFLGGNDFINLKNSVKANSQMALDSGEGLAISRNNNSVANKAQLQNYIQEKGSSIKKSVDANSNGINQTTNQGNKALNDILNGLNNQTAETKSDRSVSGSVQGRGNALVKDMGQTNAAGENKMQDVIGKISDHIVKAQFDRNNSLDVTLRHTDLGQFQVKVTKEMKGQGLDILIKPQSMEAQKFFAGHENALMKGLSDAGLKVVDLKISQSTSNFSSFENKSDGQGSSEFGKQGQQNFSGSSRQESAQQDSERRRQLWEEARMRSEQQYA